MESTMRNLSKEQIEEYRESFAAFDTDNSGTITKTELKAFMKLLGFHPTELEVAQIFKNVDKNNDNLIDFPEFCYLMERSMKGSSDELLDAFREFDTDGNGQISRDELRQTMAKLGGRLALTEEQLCHVIEAADRDGDGQINYEEFVKLMTDSARRSFKAKAASKIQRCVHWLTNCTKCMSRAKVLTSVNFALFSVVLYIAVVIYLFNTSEADLAAS